MADKKKPIRGFLTLDELALKQGWRKDTRLYLEESEEGLLIYPDVHLLRRIYVEPTNTCNLNCRTCVRRIWEEPLGNISLFTWDSLLEEVKRISPRPEIFFGGFGEPLGHPNILSMVSQAHEAGCRTELISNGVFLDDAMARGLIEAGLDFLWVSIDGADPESYLDVRLGNELPGIINKLKHLRKLRFQLRSKTPLLGFAFVGMKRNIHDLPNVVALARQLRVRKIHVSNVLPYSREMKDEILYRFSQRESEWNIHTYLFPRMDADSGILSAWEKIGAKSDWMKMGNRKFKAPFDTCPFIEKGSVSVRWDGQVSPCLPLLHAHESFLDDTYRKVEPHFYGDLANASLSEIWNSPDYRSLRERVREFDFSPCTLCNSCEMAETNQEDCFGSPPPACGGCLWAQGFISCP